MEVTEENKKEYVKAMASFKMTEEIKEQIQAFIKGFYEIIPKRSLNYVNEQELGLILSGVKKIDRKYNTQSTCFFLLYFNKQKLRT